MSTLTIQKNHDEAAGSLASLPSIVRFLFVPIRGRLSREQNRHSARVLKFQYLDLRGSCREAGGPGLAADDRCKILHSESGWAHSAIAVVNEKTTELLTVILQANLYLSVVRSTFDIVIFRQ
jgi:hypothetical protein